MSTVNQSFLIKVRVGFGAASELKRYFVRCTSNREKAIGSVLRIVGVTATILSADATDGKTFQGLLPGIGVIELAQT